MKRIIVALAVLGMMMLGNLACINEKRIGDAMGMAEAINNAAFGTPTPILEGR